MDLDKRIFKSSWPLEYLYGYPANSKIKLVIKQSKLILLSFRRIF